jgi:tRNA modification GTPase
MTGGAWVADTIAAVASPMGMGAVALVRVSGPEAVAVIDRLAGGRAAKAPERHARLAVLRDLSGVVVDEVLVTVFRAPRSFTGEDVVEIGCHGGVLVTRKVLSAVLEAGARLAEAGEFSQRAFLNQRMDLTQAEAVMDLITAQTELAMRAAHEQREGRLGRRTDALRAELLGVVAHLEAYIDFPDEDIDPDTGAAMLARIDSLIAAVQALLATADQGRILREGVRTVIYGKPNVGKSSLLNLLLGYERAIVSPTAGTTRDTVEEVVNVAGIPLRLIDTAGIRDGGDAIEVEGIRRSLQQLSRADLVLEVVDGSAPREALLDRIFSKRILILNKSDLGLHPDWQGSGGLAFSCREETGAEVLAEQIQAALSFGVADWGEHSVAINARHQDCLRRALASLEAGRSQLAVGHSPEFVAADLRDGLAAVGEISGRVDTDEILGEIFSRFCIGK